jgi:hypothetical protein
VLAQKFEASLVLLHVFAESYSSDKEIGAGAGRLLDATREDAEREVAHWKSYCVLSIPNAEAPSELVATRACATELS